jgi:adenylyltransferase/sulfurtransferase
MSFRTLKLQRDPACPICGDHPTISALMDYEAFCGVGSNGVSTTPALSSEFETTVHELKAQLDRQDAVWILDVREPHEFAISRLDGSTLIPLGDLPNRLVELPGGPGAPEIVVYCKVGGRSAKAVALLRARGFTRVKNLKGGILEWIEKIDRSLAKY